jgi:DNA-binding MarR family transcriptional regulator
LSKGGGQVKPIKRRIQTASSILTRQQHDFAASLGITSLQMSVLSFLADQANAQSSQQEIADAFQIQRSTTTVMLRRMEERHLVERVEDDFDHRKKQVALTPEAKEMMPEIQDFFAEDDRKLRQHFSSAELAAFEKGLTYILKQHD